MFLKIRHIGKVDRADIEMNGITVIAGPNNTGKSTVGKTLYCLFAALCGIDGKILEERQRQIVREINRHPAICRGIPPVSAADVFDSDGLPPKDELFSRIRRIFSEKRAACAVTYGSAPDEDDDSRIFEAIGDIYAVPDSEIQALILTRCFAMEFNGQINHIDDSGDAVVELEDAGGRLTARFSGDRCAGLDRGLFLFSKAVYLDTPLILGAAGNGSAVLGTALHHTDAAALLRRAPFGPLDGVLSEAVSRRKTAAVISKINAAIPGEFVRDPKIGDAYREDGAQNPVALSNLSSGLKMLAIIRRLVENGALEPRSLLILDEPEIHLHPEWQLVFAEIIVLLRKELGLTVLFNTHSPYFLSAIEVFSQKHGIDTDCRYCLSEITPAGHAVISDVGDDIERIYRELALPFQKLEDLRYEDVGTDRSGSVFETGDRI